MFLGHRLTRWRTPEGTTAWRKSRRHGKTPKGPSGDAPGIRGKLDGRTPNLQEWHGPHAATASESRALRSGPMPDCGRLLPPERRCPVRAFKGMSGAPTSRSNVQHHRNAGWPKGRESQGHGVLVVVRGRESRLHGEGGQ